MDSSVIRGMHAQWKPDDRHRWDAFAGAALGGLHQTWAYGHALQGLGVPCLRVAVTQDDSPKSPWLGVAQFIVQSLPWFVRFSYCQGGPLWAADVPLPLQRQALERIRRTLPLRRPRMALFSPTTLAGTAHALDDRLQLATGLSTVLIDLQRPVAERRAALEQRWRNRLNAAERSPLKLRLCGSKASDYEWLIQAEAAQRRERRYMALPPGFVPAFQEGQRKPSQALLTLSAEVDHRRCAGMLFLVHGSTATYHLAWSDDAGREHSAHNLLLWQACELLAERGVKHLDLGGVNTRRNPGLARFKLGAGGRVVTWAGTYW